MYFCSRRLCRSLAFLDDERPATGYFDSEAQGLTVFWYAALGGRVNTSSRNLLTEPPPSYVGNWVMTE